jgi:hypothetical protein
MPSYSGTLARAAADGRAGQTCPCRVDFGDEILTLIPGTDAPLAFDLGDIDKFSPADYELHLTLYSGEKLILARFGKSFQDLIRELREAHRKRLIRCLLLEDLEEIARFEGSAQLQSPGGSFSAPAEIRLYQSNLAILPQAQTGFQWRLADIESVRFDDSRYAVALGSGDEVLWLDHLAKRTTEFRDRLQTAMADVARRSALTVRSVFPFLAPEQLQRAAELMKDGHVAALAQLAAIHGKTGAALAEKVVSARLKPYYESLMSRTAPCGPYVGFKLIRKEAEPVAPEEEIQEETPEMPEQEFDSIPGEVATVATSGGNQKENGEEVLYWFLFPLKNRAGTGMPQVVAWEATSRSGRATYFFRLAAPGETAVSSDPLKQAAALNEAIRRLNCSLLLLNFRREPVYLSDDSLMMQPRYRRYAIACRKIPSLRLLRSAFLGRALHTSPQAWQQQIERLLSGM